MYGEPQALQPAILTPDHKVRNSQNNEAERELAADLWTDRRIGPLWLYLRPRAEASLDAVRWAGNMSTFVVSARWATSVFQCPPVSNLRGYRLLFLRI